MNKYLKNIGINAQKAFEKKIDTKIKNKVLDKFAYLINKNKFKIINQNKKDVNFAKKKGIKENLLRRLILDIDKIEQIIKSIKIIIKLKDPIDITLSQSKRPNGLRIKKVTIPLGVIGIIYESRPNVTSDVSSLCFKSGNSIILRGGSEAYFSNKILANLFRKALKDNKVDPNYVQFIKSRNRRLVDILLSKMEKYIDLVIPRGGKNLVKKVLKLSSVPIIGHLEGICHTYIDKDASLSSAVKIIYNAKLRNTSICEATETILIHEKCLKKFVNPV
jgi:Gamma-glutamyl phosphate reductase